MLKKLSVHILSYGGINAFKSLVPFLMLPILTRYITPKEYGNLSLIETSVLFIFPFVSLNIHGAINVEYFKLKYNEFKKYVVNALFLSFVSFIIFFFVFFIFSKNISDLIHLAPKWIQLLAFFAFLRVFSSVMLVIFQASGQVKNYALFSLSQTILDFALSYYLIVFLKEGFIGRIVGVYGALLIYTIISIFIFYKMGYFKKTFTLKYTKDILNFGVPLILHSVSGVVLAMSDRYFISYFYDNSKVGLYTAAYQVSAILLLISMSANQAWSPMFMNLMKEKNFGMVNKIIKILFILFIVSAVVVYFVKGIIYHYFIGEKFQISLEYFSPLLIGFLFQSLYFLYTNYLFYYKKTKVLAMITFLGAILNLILNYILIKKLGVIGVAYSTAITYLLFFITVVIVSKKIYYNNM